MNIIELKKIVDRLYETTKEYKELTNIGIQVKRVGSVAGTPLVNVKSIHSGFDWNAGKIIIVPETDLREINRDEIKSIQEKYDELGWKYYKINNLQRENKKLKEEIEKLNIALKEKKMIDADRISVIEDFASWDSTEYGESLLKMIDLYRCKNYIPKEMTEMLEKELESNYEYIQDNFEKVEKSSITKFNEWENKYE